MSSPHAAAAAALARRQRQRTTTPEEEAARQHWIAVHLGQGELGAARELGWEGSEHDAKAVAEAMHGGSPEARRPPAAGAPAAAAAFGAAPDLEG